MQIQNKFQQSEAKPNTMKSRTFTCGKWSRRGRRPSLRNTRM